MGLFPLGVQNYLLGGLLVGLGVSFIYIFTGYIAGASGFLSAAHSWWSSKPFFKQSNFVKGRSWKFVLVLGLVCGAALFSFIDQSSFKTDVQWWRLAIGGLLVGFGTRTAKGCTSGHGICGLSSFSAPSLVAVITFLVVAILTAFVISGAGVLP